MYNTFRLNGLRIFVLAWTALSGSGQTVEELHRTLNLRFDPPQNLTAKSVLQQGNSKIDPALRVLLQDVQAKSITELGAQAKGMQIAIEGERVAVVAAAASESEVPELRRKIEAAGGEVVAIVDEAILARVPPSGVSAVGSEKSLEYLAPQAILSLPPAQVSAQSPGQPRDLRGVMMTKANLLHQKGLKGAGVKVGILDFGFTGYQALVQRGVIPEPAAVKAFGKDNGWDRVSKGTQHGTACAEIVHAMAPGAAIYVASIGDGEGGAPADEIIRGAMWLAEQKVDIISFSGGGHNGPHNGTDLLDKLVEQIVGKGILWVNSAGNEGAKHWSTTPRLDEKGFVIAGDKPFLVAQATTNLIALQVSWDDWGGNPLVPSATQDFDAYLATVDPATNELTLVAKSENPQSGRGAPRETVFAKARPGQVFALYIRGSRVNRSPRLHVHALTPARMAPASPVGSIGIPATSRMALAVGAVDVNNAKLESYSSQGPTDDGRAKPEISGPDKVRMQSTEFAGEEGFPGTSASCPHVAGFAALLREMRALPPAEMARMIVTSGAPLAVNTGAGSGMIDASRIRIVSGGGGGGNPGASGSLSAAAARALDRMLAQASEENALGVKVVTGRTAYRIGDGLKIGFRSRQDCGCVLVHRSAGGEYTPIEMNLQLQADRRYAYPENSDTTIKITGPPGRDEVAIICSGSGSSLERIERGDTTGVAVSVARYQVEE